MFKDEIIQHLGYYVYFLKNSTDGKIFYVGKGQGNRVFAHAKAALSETEESGDLKLNKIKEMIEADDTVDIVIHRHGMSEKTAFEVEAALIDVLDELTNIKSGHASADRGPLSIDEINKKFAAPIADITDPIVAITINRSLQNMDVYNASRFCWRMSKVRVKKVKFVLAIEKGLVVGVYEPSTWLEATMDNFPEFNKTIEKRIGFVGKEASPEILNKYLHHRLPDKYRPKGASNPIRYINC